MTSHLSENEDNDYKMATSIFPKFLVFERDISRTIWCNEVNDGSYFAFFHAISFELAYFLLGVPPFKNSAKLKV